MKNIHDTVTCLFTFFYLNSIATDIYQVFLCRADLHLITTKYRTSFRFYNSKQLWPRSVQKRSGRISLFESTSLLNTAVLMHLNGTTMSQFTIVIVLIVGHVVIAQEDIQDTTTVEPDVEVTETSTSIDYMEIQCPEVKISCT